MLISSLLFGISASLDALLVGISYGIRQIRIKFWQNLIISLVTLLGTCLSVGLGHKIIPFLPVTIQGCAGSLILILLGLYYIVKWVIASLQNCRPKASPEAGHPLEITSASVKETTFTSSSYCSGDASLSSGSYCSDDASLSSSSYCSGDASFSSSSYCSGDASFSSKPSCSRKTSPSPQLKLVEVFALSLTLSLNNLSAGLSASLAGLTLLPTAISTLICSILFLFSGNRLGENPVLQLAGRAADPLSGALLIGLGLVQLFI